MMLTRPKLAFAVPRVRVAVRGPLFAAAVFVLAFAGTVRPFVGGTFAYLPGDLVDNRLNNFVLEHGYRWATRQTKEFWHVAFCHPARWVTASSDAHLGNLPLYAIFRAAGAGPERAFQLWWVTTFVLTYAATVWAVRRLGTGLNNPARSATSGSLPPCGGGLGWGVRGCTGEDHSPSAEATPLPNPPPQGGREQNRPPTESDASDSASVNSAWLAAIVAATVFTFGPSQMLCMGHAQLFPRYFVPPAVVFFWEFLHRPGWKKLLAAVACWVGQVYCTVYIGYFLALLLVALAAAFAVVGRPHGRRLVWPGVRESVLRLLVLTAGAVALYPQLRPYLAPDRESWKPPADLVISYLPKPIDWLRASETSAAWSWTCTTIGGEDTAATPTFHLFPGAAAVAGLLFGVGGLLGRSLRRPPAAVFALAAIFLAAFVLHAPGWTPYRVLLGVPFAGSVRGVFRVGLLVLFPLAVLAGLAAARLVEVVRQKWGARTGWFAVVGVVGVVLLDVKSHEPGGVETGIGRMSIADNVARREALAAVVRPHADATTVLYVFPPPGGREHDALVTQVDAMWVSQTLGIPTVNGWTGHWPAGWYPFPDYSSLFWWLVSKNGVPAEHLGRVLLFGVPAANDSPLEQQFRAKFPAKVWPTTVGHSLRE